MSNTKDPDARLAVLALVDRCKSTLPPDRADWDMRDRSVAATCDKAASGDLDAVEELRYLEDSGLIRP